MSPGLTSDLLGQRLLSRLQDPQVQQSGSGLSLDDKDLTFFIDDLHTALGDHGINKNNLLFVNWNFVYIKLRIPLLQGQLHENKLFSVYILAFI